LSAAEETLALLLRVEGVPAPEREWRFHPKRRWRFDFAWPAEKVAVEVEGGIWTRGRHNRPAGYQADCEKYNEAALMGWRVLRVVPEHVDSGEAIGWISRALKETPHAD